MHQSRTRTVVLGLLGAVLLITLARMLAGLGGDGGASQGDPDLARVEKLAENGDVEALAQEVDHQRIEVARRAVRGLGRIGRRAAPRIENLLRVNPRPEVREEAALALAKAAGDERALVLAEAAKRDKSPDVRAAAVTGLASVRAVDEMEAIFDALLDENRMVRIRAAAAVDKITGRRWELYVDGPAHKRAEAVQKLRQAWPGMKANPKLYWDRQKQRLAERRD